MISRQRLACSYGSADSMPIGAVPATNTWRPSRTAREYPNIAIELAAELVAEHAGMPFSDYLRQAVLAPRGFAGALHGSPAWGYRGPIGDLLALGRELLSPTLVAPETLAEATSVQFPGLVG